MANLSKSLTAKAMEDWINARMQPGLSSFYDPRHEYDYPSAYLGHLLGEQVYNEDTKHWSSKYKTKKHPTYYLQFLQDRGK
jgi:hypothetical protein